MPPRAARAGALFSAGPRTCRRRRTAPPAPRRAGDCEAAPAPHPPPAPPWPQKWPRPAAHRRGCRRGGHSFRPKQLIRPAAHRRGCRRGVCLPATGRLRVYRKPQCSAFTVADVRIDHGVAENDTVSPHYDLMIAKLIVRGDARAQALAQLHIVGVANNAEFLRRVVRSASFAHARLDTALIERERDALFGPPALPSSMAAAIAVGVHAGHRGRCRAAAGRRGGPRPLERARRLCQSRAAQRRFAFPWGEDTAPAHLTWRRDGTRWLVVGEGDAATGGALAWQADPGGGWALGVSLAARRCGSPSIPTANACTCSPR